MIEDEIKNEFESYEIKTTSKMILDRMPKKSPKRRFFNLKFLIPTFTVVGASAAALIIILSINLNKTNSSTGNTAIALTSDSLESQLALEVLYAGSMDSVNNSETKLLASGPKDKPTSSEFALIVDNMETIYPLFNNIDDGFESFNIYYEKGEFTKLNKSYSYKYTIGEYGLYSNEYFVVEDKNEIDLESDIALELGEAIYSGSLGIEKETGHGETEFEVTLSYSVGKNTIIIEREVETDGDEFENSYTYSYEGDTSYKKKVSLKNEDGIKKFRYKLEDEENDIYETLKLKEVSNGYKIGYSYQSSSEEYEVEDVKFTLNDGIRTYTLDSFIETRK